MASTYTGFYIFTTDILTGQHDFDNDDFYVMLTNVEPDWANALTYNDITEITPQNGYTAGGLPVTVALNLVADESIVTGDPVIFEATGGAFGPFEWAVIYNFSKPAQPLVAGWAYEGGSIQLLEDEQITLVFGSVNGVFKVGPA